MLAKAKSTSILKKDFKMKIEKKENQVKKIMI